jgi:hypothetical protein
MNLMTRLTIAWAVLFAIVHGYWAAGGEAGMNGEPADSLGAQLYIGVIALIGLAGAGVAYGLWREPGRRALVRITRLGGAALLLGVAVGTTRWIADGGVGSDGAAGVITTLYFLAGGALFVRLSRPARVSPC